jgi:hypothetical protein
MGRYTIIIILITTEESLNRIGGKEGHVWNKGLKNILKEHKMLYKRDLNMGVIIGRKMLPKGDLNMGVII